MTRLLLFGLLVLLASPAQALLFCTRPDPPSCLISLGMADRYEFDFCRSQVESYRSDVQEYVACLRKEQNAVLEELGEAIRKFNDCANNRYC